MSGVSWKNAWREAGVAAEYEARRFRTPLQRLKHRRDEALLLELLRSTAGVRRVLDLPCGTGRFFPALQAHGYRVAGADIALEMMRAGRARAAGRGWLGLVQADALRLPFQNGAFDAVVSLRFLFHMEAAERRRSLAEMRRVTRSGIVLGQVRYRWTWKHLGRWIRSRLGLCRRYRPAPDRRALARELEGAGLELVLVRPVSRLFSDKALFLARPPWSPTPPAIPSEVGSC